MMHMRDQVEDKAECLKAGAEIQQLRTVKEFE